MANENEQDDFSAGLAELQSEQFMDGEPYRREDDGTVKRGAELDEANNDAEGNDDVQDPADEEVNENEPENDDAEGDDEDDKEGDEDDDAEGDEDKSKDQKPNRWQRRVDKLTADLRRMERTLAEERAARNKPTPPTDASGKPVDARTYAKKALETDEKAPKKPDASKFKLGEFDEGYRDAYDDYLDERRDYLLAKEAEFDEKFGNASAAPGGNEPTADEFRGKIETFIGNADNKKVAGFDAAVEAAKKDEWPLSAVVAELIVDSEVGAAIAVHLHQNPKLAKEIADLSPVKQAARFGKLEDKFIAERDAKKKAAKRPSAAPAPIGANRGSGNAPPKGYSSENFDEVERRWNTDERKRAGR